MFAMLAMFSRSDSQAPDFPGKKSFASDLMDLLVAHAVHHVHDGSMSRRTSAFFRGLVAGMDPTRVLRSRTLRGPSRMDEATIRKDWEHVGGDLREAMHRYVYETEGVDTRPLALATIALPKTRRNSAA